MIFLRRSITKGSQDERTFSCLTVPIIPQKIRQRCSIMWNFTQKSITSSSSPARYHRKQNKKHLCNSPSHGKFIFKLSFYITVFQKIISFLGLSGDAHFDDDELFTTGTPNGINLDWVAVHEFGHSMGLEHSNVRESIMYPWYKGYFPNIELTEDDILGIQDIYGKCSGVKARNSTRSCRSRNWDA